MELRSRYWEEETRKQRRRRRRKWLNTGSAGGDGFSRELGIFQQKLPVYKMYRTNRKSDCFSTFLAADRSGCIINALFGPQDHKTFSDSQSTASHTEHTLSKASHQLFLSDILRLLPASIPSNRSPNLNPSHFCHRREHETGWTVRGRSDSRKHH